MSAAEPACGLFRAEVAGAPAWVWCESGRAVALAAGAAGEELAAVVGLLRDPGVRARALAGGRELAAAEWLAARRLRPGRPGKALCLGRNFAEHAREFGLAPPPELVWFAKLPDVLTGPGAAVPIPAWLQGRVDPEAEVVVLIGAALSDASLEEAEAALAAYTLGNDVTARGQVAEDRKRGWPWLRCKNLAGFGPLGPAWVPAPVLGALAAIELRGLVDGELRQCAKLGDLLWSPAAALAEISRWTPLLAGDVVFLGTPAGVAPVHPGELLQVEADGLGRLENPVTTRA
ncbi:MAG TPA: fumarylacetoacetate hydrolase family protein [Planctomycetota bacterium]